MDSRLTYVKATSRADSFRRDAALHTPVHRTRRSHPRRVALIAAMLRMHRG
jgi:hypothetical protein